MSLPFLHLPAEIWDHIAENLSEPEDLLRFALANSRIRDVVIPHHLNWSKLWTDNCNTALWTNLTAKQAGRVRELRIDCFTSDMYDDDDPDWVESAVESWESKAGLMYCIHRDFSSSVDEEECLCRDCEGTVLPSWAAPMGRAVAMMTGLRKLAISCSLCDFFRISEGRFFRNLVNDLEDLELRLLPCPCYTDKYVGEDTAPHGDEAEGITETMPELSYGYSRFSFHWELKWEPYEISNILDYVSRELNEHCRDLHVLEISVDTEELDPDFAGYQCGDLCRARWDSLHSLSLHGVALINEYEDEIDSQYGVDLITAFFNHHYQLEELRITRALIPPMDDGLMIFGFPELRVLHLDRFGLSFLRDVLDIFEPWEDPKVARGRPIESLTVDFDTRTLFPSSDVIGAVDIICLHGSTTGTIRQLTCNFGRYAAENGYWLRMIGQCNPLLTELTTQPRFACHSFELLTLLRWFPNMEVLRSKDASWMESLFRESTQTLKSFLEVLPKLRQVDGWVRQKAGIWRHQTTSAKVECTE